MRFSRSFLSILSISVMENPLSGKLGWKWFTICSTTADSLFLCLQLTMVQSTAFCFFSAWSLRSVQNRLAVAVLPVPTLPVRTAFWAPSSSTTGLKSMIRRFIWFSLCTSLGGT